MHKIRGVALGLISLSVSSAWASEIVRCAIMDEKGKKTSLSLVWSEYDGVVEPLQLTDRGNPIAQVPPGQYQPLRSLGGTRDVLSMVARKPGAEEPFAVLFAEVKNEPNRGLIARGPVHFSETWVPAATSKKSRSVECEFLD